MLNPHNSLLGCHKTCSSLSMQSIRPYVSIPLKTAAAFSAFAYSQDAFTLCPLVLNSDIFFSNGKKKKSVLSISGILKWCLPRSEKKVHRQQTTLEWPQLCVVSTQAACPWSFLRACAFNPSQWTSTCAHFLPILKTLPHHICEGLVLERAKQSLSSPPLICQ